MEVHVLYTGKEQAEHEKQLPLKEIKYNYSFYYT